MKCPHFGTPCIAGVDLPFSFQFAFETCFASNSVSITSRSLTAPQALLQLQDISEDCSDGKDFNIEVDNALDNNLEEKELVSSGEESDVNSASNDNDNDLQNQLQVLDLIIKNEIVWLVLATLPMCNMDGCNSKTN